MKVFLAGNIGREAAIAERLALEDCELHIAAEFRNPSLVKAAEQTEGQFYEVDDLRDIRRLTEIALASQAEIAWINQDDLLAAGAVDRIHEWAPDMAMASPDQEGARIEWDKFDSRKIVERIDVENRTSYNPQHFCITEPNDVAPFIHLFREQGQEIVVKPRGLTGGKGVKVMGPHLKSYEAAQGYAAEVLRDPRQGGVLIEEKLEGQEFTVQGLTDGKTLIVPPATYDYPYREDGDTGPGTGGMGSFTMRPGETLPFLSQRDYEEAAGVMDSVLEKLREEGRDFKGVLYGSFFKTARGLKVVEFNARIGDPEGINIMELLDDDTSLIEVLNRISQQNLRPQDVGFKDMASTAVYLVAPDYAYTGGNAWDFELDTEKIAKHGCWTYFAAAKQVGHNRYRTAGSSRTVAVAALEATPWEARAKIDEAIADAVAGPLEYRHDIGSKEYIDRLG